MSDEEYILQLRIANSLREPVLQEMVKGLGVTAGSRGLDAGCGIGLQCRQLAEEAGPAGHVTGLDMSTEMLEYGRQIAEEAGLTGRISFRQGDIAAMPFDDETFDWAWSVDCVGYGPWDTMTMLKEMRRVLKPGGILAVAAWSSEKLLPGYPRLEARLGATAPGIAPFHAGRDPALHFQRGLGWFRKLGLENSTAQVFAGSASAPLSDDVRQALIELLAMRWPGAQAELSPEDAAEFRRLCQPDSPDFILDLPDYSALFTYTMFWGNKPGG